ncbi:mucin-2 [Streptomyces diacarni]|uniref:PP2C family protein-serine/threonine phosphatase n=1 Tax=Streptomyces diacarni TaxID=2800381 RepID=UPI0033EFE4E4
MRTYATAQNVGTDPGQADATAVSTAPSGARAYVLLDGIGRSDDVRDWARAAARRLARAAARRGDAEAGLRAVYDAYSAERADADPWGPRQPKAAAVVAVTAPGRPLTVAWCGDSRAYVIARGTARQLTNDHNLRRVYPPTDWHDGGNRNVITSSLGSRGSDQDVKNHYGHPAIEAVTRPAEDCRLVLASDGAYEPHEDTGHPLADELVGDPREAARHFVDSAVRRATAATRAVDPSRTYADNATALIADIRP